MEISHIVVGLGKSGLAAQQLLKATGLKPDSIKSFDEKNPNADFKSWKEIESLPPGTLVVSPGVPLQSQFIQNLQKQGWQITSEIGLAAKYLTSEIVIGITGSVGKSTVTSLIGEAVKQDDPFAFVGGNLGIPFCEYALRLINKGPKAKYVVLELSSYQLENCQPLQLDYSAITFLSANHLERYPDKNSYYLTKCQIGKMTKNTCYINSSSLDLMSYAKQIPGQVVTTNYSTSAHKNKIDTACLFGAHNKDNIALALSLLEPLKLSPEAISQLLQFKGLEHRLEYVGLFHNVLFINDSKATAMDSVLVATQAALDKLQSSSTLYLLLGGKDKNLPWEELSSLQSFSEIEFVFFGACGEIAKNKSGLEGNYFKTLSDCLDFVFQKVKENDIVLLSPGGTSLDEFKSFEDRGSFFKNKILKFYSNQ